MIIRRFLSTLIFLSLVDLTYAQINTDRPSFSVGAVTLNEGDLQLESGASIEYYSMNSLDVIHKKVPSLLLRFGVVKGVEFRIENQLELIRESDNGFINEYGGNSNLKLGLKLNIFDIEEKNLKMTALGNIGFPLVSNSVNQGDRTWGAALLVSHSVRKKSSVLYNLGIEDFDHYLSICFNTPLHKKAGIFIEPYALNFIDDPFILNLNVGITYEMVKNLQVDLAYGIAANSQRYSIYTIGLSWLLVKEK